MTFRLSNSEFLLSDASRKRSSRGFRASRSDWETNVDLESMRQTAIKALDWATSVDIPAAKKAVAAMRKDHPKDTPDELAARLCESAVWKSAAAGVALGIASNPFVAVGAALADAAVTLRTQLEMAGRVALCHDPNHFDNEGAVEELLVPVMGATAAHEMLKGIGPVGAVSLTQQLIRKSMTGQGSGLIQSFAIRVLMRQLPQRGFASKAIPLLGGLISGVWNWNDTSRAGDRVRAYFRGDPLPAD